MKMAMFVQVLVWSNLVFGGCATRYPPLPLEVAEPVAVMQVVDAGKPDGGKADNSESSKPKDVSQEDPCKTKPICKLYGKCSTGVGGECVALTNGDCQASDFCVSFVLHACTAQGGSCVFGCAQLGWSPGEAKCNVFIPSMRKHHTTLYFCNEDNIVDVYYCKDWCVKSGWSGGYCDHDFDLGQSDCFCE